MNKSCTVLSAGKLPLPINPQTHPDRSTPSTDTPILSTLLDEHQAARMVGYTVAGLRTRRYANLPPVFYKLGGKVRYAAEDLFAWIASARQPVQQ